MRYQPWVGLPNIIAGEFIVPELLQENATPENLAQALFNVSQDPVVVELDDLDKMWKYPYVFMTSETEFELESKHADNLREFLLRGGFIHADDCCHPNTKGRICKSDLGENFDDFAQAQPGDFMKIFWSPEVGRSEHGHSVIYLGMERKGGLDYVRFWSSNIPGGYGERSVPRSKIVHAIFSRLDEPANLSRATTVPPVDRYLASLLSSRSSYEEAKQKCGM